MWIELALASGAISAVCGSILAINKIFPAETKRFLRIVQAEITARIPSKPKRPTLEVALHAGVEVDIKWWDEEFDKLQRAIPDKGWARMVESKVDVINTPTMAEITRADLLRWHAHGVKQVTQGDFTFNVSNLLNSHAALSKVEAEKKLKEQLVEFERVKHEMSRKAPSSADATPPGLPHSLREAQNAGVPLEKARARSVVAFQAAPGAHAMPRPVSIQARSRIENAATWDGLVQAVSWTNLMIAKHGRPEECEFCEYEEVHTYADPYVKRYKTEQCWECKTSGPKGPDGVKGPVYSHLDL